MEQFQWPLDTFIPSREFDQQHEAMDLAAPLGVEVRASSAGRVAVVQRAGEPADDGEGNAVWIDHGAGLMTGYAHLSACPALTVGEVVAAGQRLGTVGASGAASGPHVHFSALVWGTPINPRDLVRKGRGATWSL